MWILIAWAGCMRGTERHPLSHSPTAPTTRRGTKYASITTTRKRMANLPGPKPWSNVFQGWTSAKDGRGRASQWPTIVINSGFIAYVFMKTLMNDVIGI
eukprot:6745280-Prymnesium_polylepis.1